MSRDQFQDVLDYHNQVAPDIPKPLPCVPTGGKDAYYGLGFIKEELAELEAAMDRGDVVEVADGLGDLVYVAHRCALIWGIDLRPVHDEIHRANLSKVDGGILRRIDGKIMKGPNYRAPDIAGVLARQEPLRREVES